jgi:TrmH family RNA methyltransferase
VPELITSTANPLVKRLRKLRHRRFRTSEGVFLIEGIAQVRQAIDHAAPLEMLLVAPDLLTSESAWAVIEEQRASGVTVHELGREAFESIVERDHPSGLAGTARITPSPVSTLSADESSLFVALHDVSNPGNLGSIIRAVDACGGSGVVIVGDSTDPHHPAAVKASMGTLFSIPVHNALDLDELFAWALMEDVEVITTSAKATVDVWEHRFVAPTLLLLGSETTGLPKEALDRGTAVTIPMWGAASSLNLAVAAGILLYEARRQLGPPKVGR